MSEQFIFGYGSLVNTATHDYGQVHVAELKGWRRVWHYTSLRDLAYLSAIPDQGSTIMGVVLKVPPMDANLENREQAYARHHVSDTVTHPLKIASDINVFAIPPKVHRPCQAESTLLLSYIDVVVQGYMRKFGEPGVQQFFETTFGWGAPVLDDRANPIYPRHQRLSKQETELTDHYLNTLSSVVKQL